MLTNINQYDQPPVPHYDIQHDNQPLTQRYHNAKVQYYAEFMKRLFFQSKYISLCKLCEEFMDELVDSLNQVVYKQRGAITETFELSDSSPTMTEIGADGSNPDQGGVIAKIVKIQEKLNQIDINEESIIEKYRNTLRDSKDSATKANKENEVLRTLVRDVKDRLSDLQEKEAQFKASEENQLNYMELLQKFDTMQSHFSYLEDYFKTGSVSENIAELDKIRKLLTQANKKNLELETQLHRAERTIRDKTIVLESLTKQVLDMESQVTVLTKEKETLQSQKHAGEARIKVLQGTLKTAEKDKDRAATVMLEKDQYIVKLENEKRSLDIQLDTEKKTAGKKLEDISGSLKELTRLARVKDNEIESLRSMCSEYQGESQKLVKSMVEKEKENTILGLRLKDAQAQYEQTMREFEGQVKQKVEERFSDIVVYIDQKETEVESLRRQLNERNLEHNYIAESEGKKLKDMEDVVYNLAKQLREREKENGELKLFIEDYQNVIKGMKDIKEFPFEAQF